MNLSSITIHNGSKKQLAVDLYEQIQLITPLSVVHILFEADSQRTQENKVFLSFLLIILLGGSTSTPSISPSPGK
jgi:hypothetical protein